MFVCNLGLMNKGQNGLGDMLDFFDVSYIYEVFCFVFCKSLLRYDQNHCYIQEYNDSFRFTKAFHLMCH